MTRTQTAVAIYLALSFVYTLQAQKPLQTYDVFMKEKKIGKIEVFEQQNESQTIRELKTESDAKVLAFAVHVESDVKVRKQKKVLIEGTAYRHASRGPDDVHAHTKLTATQYEREQNGKKSAVAAKEITFCVVDLYFEEPKGLTKLFSNMYADFMTVKASGNGRYEVKSPDKKTTYYTYKNGQLMTIEAETPAGSVISKRQ